MSWLLQRRRTAVFVGVTLALAVLLLLVALLRLMTAAGAYGDEVDRLRPRIARLSGLEAIEGSLAEQMESATRQLSELVYPASEDSSALAATLQADIRRVFEEAGMDVTNSQTSVRSDEDFERISVKVTLRGGIDALDASLRGLSALRPRVLVESLDAYPSRGDRRATGQSVGAVIQIAVLRGLS
ncbi:MAG: type II secretion system protein GspM [Pseudomonadota bacterium]